MTTPGKSRCAVGLALGWRKRVLFRLVLLALVAGVAEFSAHVGYYLVTHAWVYRTLSHHGANGAAEADRRSKSPPKYRYMMLHPFLGFVGDPTQNDRTFLEVHDNLYPINEYGFVDQGPPIHRRAPDKVIIGITGGSVACFFSQHGVDALRQQLQHDSRFSGKEIVFVRLAVPGHKQPQQVMTLAYVLALGGQLDVLVNIDGFNEVALYPSENRTAGIHPLFPRMWNHYIAESPDPETAQLKGQIGYLESQRDRLADWLSHSRLRFLAIAHLACQVRDRYLEHAVYRASLGLLKRQPLALKTAATGPPFPFANDQAMYAELADIWRRCSLQLDALCRANRVEYYHFLQPNQYVAESKPLSDEERRVAYVEDHPYRAGVVHGYPLLQQAGRELIEQGVTFRDLSGIFAEHQESLYYDACCHFVHTGNEIMAVPIAQEILAHFAPADRVDASPALHAQRPRERTAVER